MGASFPQDGLCDALVYTQLDTVTNVKRSVTPNLRTFWQVAKKADQIRLFLFRRDTIFASGPDQGVCQ